jgi:hypothetical protein
MEAVVLALAALASHYWPPKRLVAEIDDFRPFDLQALRRPNDPADNQRTLSRLKVRLRCLSAAG